MAALVNVTQTPPDHLAAWLTFIGAVGGATIVAIIAAVTAQKRLNARLASEERRHRDQFDFQRGETDRAELRSILDGLAEQLLRIEDAAGEALAAAQAYSALWRDDISAEGRRDLRAIKDRLSNETYNLAGHRQRLNLRLGDEAMGLDLAASESKDSAALWMPLTRDPPFAEDVLDGMQERKRAISEANRRFMTRALKYTHAWLMAMRWTAENGAILAITLGEALRAPRSPGSRSRDRALSSAGSFRLPEQMNRTSRRYEDGVVSEPDLDLTGSKGSRFNAWHGPPKSSLTIWSP